MSNPLPSDPVAEAKERLSLVTAWLRDCSQFTPYPSTEEGDELFAHDITTLLEALASSEARGKELEGGLTDLHILRNSELVSLEDAEKLAERMGKALEEASAALLTAETLMQAKGWWRNDAGYLTDAALWIEKAARALQPRDQQVDGEKSREDLNPTVQLPDQEGGG